MIKYVCRMPGNSVGGGGGPSGRRGADVGLRGRGRRGGVRPSHKFV